MKHIDGIEALRLAQIANTYVLDVRTQKEFATGSLPNAHLIPVDQLAQRLDELPEDRNSLLLVYCAHGVRSVFACTLLEQNGYKNLVNLKSGIAGLEHK